MATTKPQSDHKTTGVRPFLREFWAGMTDLSMLSLAVCICTFLATAAFMLWLFSPSGMESRLGAFVPRSKMDADAFATVESVRLARDTGTEPTLVFMGSSTVAQMVGNGNQIRDILQDHESGPWDVRILTTPLQGPLDQLALLDHVLAARTETSPPIVVLMGIGLPRLGWSTDRIVEVAKSQRVGIRSDWQDEELARLGGVPARRFPISAVEVSPFLIRNGLATMTRLALLTPVERVVDVYSRGREGVNRGRGQILKNIEAGRTNPEAVLSLLASLSDRIATTPGAHLVFIEEPLSPEIVEVGDLADALIEFRSDMAAFATEHGSQFWPVIQRAELAQQDYFDDLHIRRGAPQERCRQQILLGMSQFIEGM